MTGALLGALLILVSSYSLFYFNLVTYMTEIRTSIALSENSFLVFEALCDYALVVYREQKKGYNGPGPFPGSAIKTEVAQGYLNIELTYYQEKVIRQCAFS